MAVTYNLGESLSLDLEPSVKYDHFIWELSLPDTKYAQFESVYGQKWRKENNFTEGTIRKIRRPSMDKNWENEKPSTEELSDKYDHLMNERLNG